jgi:hypothetical protein
MERDRNAPPFVVVAKRGIHKKGARIDAHTAIAHHIVSIRASFEQLRTLI